MRDRLPTPGKENRVRITQDNGQVVEGVLSYADGATQEGSAYTKGNVLPDDVCGLLGIDPVTSEPKDAWLGVISAVGYCLVTVQVRGVAGAPLPGVRVAGLVGVPDAKTSTDAGGNLFLVMQEGDYTLSVPEIQCIDADMPEQRAHITPGRPQTIELRMVSKSTTSARITTSQSVTFSDGVSSYDVFLVGGGGIGGAGGGSNATNTNGSPGGGGGGGQCKTLLDVAPQPFSPILCAVGSGAGDTRFGEEIAQRGESGGSGETKGPNSIAGKGGSGGSGGGGGAPFGSDAGRGGADGSDGARGGVEGGRGQGTSTRAFGEPTGSLFAGGGGGGGSYYNGEDGYPGAGGAGGGGKGGVGGAGSEPPRPGEAGVANTGGGGGGGGGGYTNSVAYGGAGGSGIILLRWRNKV